MPRMRIPARSPGAGARLSGMVTSSSPTAGRAVGRGSGGGGGAAAAAGAPRAVSVGPGSSSPAASTSLSTSSAASGAAVKAGQSSESVVRACFARNARIGVAASVKALA